MLPLPNESRVKHALVTWLAPASVFLLLTGLLWLPERGGFPKLFYLGMICALALTAIDFRSLKDFFNQPLVRAILLFAVYFSLSLFWTTAEEGWGTLLKRQSIIFLLFLLIFELGHQKFDSLKKGISLASVFAVLAALFEVGVFLAEGQGDRLASKGALSNPLLISHLYGFFGSLWLAWFFSAKSRTTALLALIPILLLLVLTGSRTPLLAFFATVVWLSILTGSRVARTSLLACLAIGVFLYVFFPELITSRGLSYRPEIWLNVLEQIKTQPVLGHGISAPLYIDIPQIGYSFRDPHNMTLSVFYQGGAVGLMLWVAMYALALLFCWRHRADQYVLMASAALVYGAMAGMTEGGAIFSRPKEHWFLLWIPMALLVAALDRKLKDGKPTR